MTFLFDLTVRATIILLTAAAVCLGLGRFSASTRHAVWTVALLNVLALPLLMVVAPSIELPVLQSPPMPLSGAPPIDATRVSEPESVAAFPLSTAQPVPSGELKLDATRSVGTRRSLTAVVFALWAAGFVLLMARLLVGIHFVQRIINESKPADETWVRLLEELRSNSSISSPVRVAVAAGALPPLTSAVKPTVILLPSSASEWDGDRRKFVLAHELAHLRRHDGLMQVLAQITCAIHWFNPLVWFAAGRLQLERERACDDAVLTMGADADQYASHLLQLARAASRPPLPTAAMSMAQASQLEARLLAIIDRHRNRRRLSKTRAAALSFAAAVSSLLIAAIHLTALPLPFVLQAPIPAPIMERTILHETLLPQTPRADVTLRQTLKPAVTDIEFIRIPPGEFTMGCSAGEGCWEVEAPPHRVQITRSFEMGRFEVTQSQWQSQMGTNPSDFKGPDLPVEQVSWNDAQQFLDQLNAHNDGYRYRFPTEAEWEYAARAGSPIFWLSGPRIPRIDNSSPLDAIAWFGRNSGGQTHPVGGKLPNAWGLYDMIGNVEELVADWYSDSYYTNSPLRDPSGPDSGLSRVVRGLPSWEVPIAPRFRHGVGPGVGYDFMGFRVARESIRSQSPSNRSSFEVASIKPNRSGITPSSMGIGPVGPATGPMGCHGTDRGPQSIPLGRCIFKNVTAGFLISAISVLDETEYKLGPVPGWVTNEGFDIEAKAESPVTQKELGEMLVSLLVDRFKCSFRAETREVDGFALVAGKQGAKLERAEDQTPLTPKEENTSISVRMNARVLPATGPNATTALMISKKARMSTLASVVSRFWTGPVVDKTGLDGFYAFELRWEPGTVLLTATTDSAGPSFTTAIDEQLGLRLQPQKVAVPFVVIDHIEKPLVN